MINTNKSIMKGLKFVMIDSQYALKYSFPHSIVHIVDNSGYQGELPTVTAEDPSLYSTLVVTGLPMGEDNKIVTVTNSNILNTAYGLANISKSDFNKYGQAIEYPTSLVEQGAPVRLMRVTPDDATYGFVTILASYKWVEPSAADADKVDPILHVRFSSSTDVPIGATLNNFKNNKRLANAIFNSYAKSEPDKDGWTTRALCVVTSTGRGSVYNNMSFYINQVSQVKNPASTRYLFGTIDNRVSATTESFVAALIDDDNSRIDKPVSVNTNVQQRPSGASILMPYINEDAVREIYKVYFTKYTEVKDLDKYVTDSFVQNVYKTLNINTFDLLFGKHIYAGGLDTSLPFYQVDMLDSDIPRLAKNYRIITNETEFEANGDKTLKDSLVDICYGVKRTGDSTYVGDVYLGTTGSNNANPRLTVVTSINQYSGAVTSVTFTTVYPMDSTGSKVDKAATPVRIKAVVNDVNEIEKLKTNNKVSVGDVVGRIKSSTDSGSSFELIYVGETKNTTYTDAQVRCAINYAEKTGVENILGITSIDPAWNIVGYAVIDVGDSTNEGTGKVYVNDYNVTKEGAITDNRIEVTGCKLRFGVVNSPVSITTDVIGKSYDILVYSDEAISAYTVTGATIAEAGTGYAKGDVVKISSNDKISFTVTSVDESGAVKEVTPVAGSISTTNTAITEDSVTGGTGSGLKLTINTVNFVASAYDETKDPLYIRRYLVSSAYGSLFKVQNDSTTIPANYYSPNYGINLDSEYGGVTLANGYTGFFDDEDISSVEFKWNYSKLMVDAFRGRKDSRITSPTRCPAKYLFDAGWNTIVGQTIVPNVKYSVSDIINASTIFTDDEKEDILFNPQTIESLNGDDDVDVKQAMYDLMISRVYNNIPEDKRPIGPGYGFSLHLDSGVTDGYTALLVQKSFGKRFTNPNASWDIGGVNDTFGKSWTYVSWIAKHLVSHCRSTSVNKPYAGPYSTIPANNVVSCFPDIDETDYEERELLYNSGGNSWIPNSNGDIERKSQRTLKSDDMSSDLAQESNMRTLGQYAHLLKNKIDSYILEYSDDAVLKTLQDDCENTFSNWDGNLCQSHVVEFSRDTNTDGGDVVVCNSGLVFRGLILRSPIIINVNRRDS